MPRSGCPMHFLFDFTPQILLGCVLLWWTSSWVLGCLPKKEFTVERRTNIMITGGAMGLGKLLAETFVRKHETGSVNLIVVDVRGDLKNELLNDIRTVSGNAQFKHATFYEANLADTNQTKLVWDQIVKDHGPVHILVNNHAICVGKRVDEHTIERFKLTMDINFNSYVHLTMLFMAQSSIKDAKEAGRFHLVNVNSIAGHMTCQRNADYSASKFALTGFTDALRQELEF